MSTKRDCLQLIEMLRTAASDAESAYLIRTRLGRAILACARLAAQASSIAEPMLPGYQSLPKGAPSDVRDLIQACNRVYARSRTVCQPSEAFEARWQAVWPELIQDLGDLERAVNRFGREELEPEARIL